ncbi:glycosyltransferase family 2 protein [Thalassobellus citreus]|uniref:glycosyltransferase family 2 protein n=1 Tax=Thalassobellus citreus TaxID=3367752 RepID=UPI00379CF146
MQDLVSIIIPTYNRAGLIVDTLNSLLSQSYTNWECIVVDDGSTDNTPNVLEKYIKKDSRFQYYRRPKDMLKGANNCRNYGFEMSNGAYVNWFDDDDVMLPGFLKEKTSVLNTNLNMVIGSGYYVNNRLENRKEIVLNNKGYLFKDYALWHLQILTPSVLIKKSFLEGKRLFINEIKRGQETEFFSRIFFKLPEESYQIVDKPLFLYRQHDQTKSAKNKKYNHDYKESQSFIAVENLKRSIALSDLELVSFYYKLLINLFFRGIENNHLKNSKYILRKLILTLYAHNKKLSSELCFFGCMFLVLKRGSYQIEKRFRTYKIFVI